MAAVGAECGDNPHAATHGQAMDLAVSVAYFGARDCDGLVMWRQFRGGLGMRPALDVVRKSRPPRLRGPHPKAGPGTV